MIVICPDFGRIIVVLHVVLISYGPVLHYCLWYPGSDVALTCIHRTTFASNLHLIWSRYNMVVGGLTLKKQKAYELPCKDEDASYLFYLEKGSAAPCYPETHPAASCWDWDNCTYDNLTDTVGLPPGSKSNGE